VPLIAVALGAAALILCVTDLGRTGELLGFAAAAGAVGAGALTLVRRIFPVELGGLALALAAAALLLDGAARLLAR
jgi:hypothetical protein